MKESLSAAQMNCSFPCGDIHEASTSNARLATLYCMIMCKDTGFSMSTTICDIARRKRMACFVQAHSLVAAAFSPAIQLGCVCPCNPIRLAIFKYLMVICKRLSPHLVKLIGESGDSGQSTEQILQEPLSPTTFTTTQK